jgi:hypothetical protein
MSIELTLEQHRAIEREGMTPPHLTDPLTGQEYVLLQADVYERVRYLAGEEFDPRTAYPFVDLVMAEDDANDPHLQSYQSVRHGGGT